MSTVLFLFPDYVHSSYISVMHNLVWCSQSLTPSLVFAVFSFRWDTRDSALTRFRLHCHVLSRRPVHLQAHPVTKPLSIVTVPLPSSVSAAPRGSRRSYHCSILTFWILLLSCGACLLWPILIAAHSRPHMSLRCAIVSECMGLHALHMKGWLWLTSPRRRKEGLGGSASRLTLMVNPAFSSPPVFFSSTVCLSVCLCPLSLSLYVCLMCVSVCMSVHVCVRVWWSVC